jgi:Carboxypeptidase regulatory-like domain
MSKNNLLLLILSLLLAVSAVGQAVYGSITGTLTDPAAAVVPGAHVAIHDVDRGTDYDTVANSSGNFTQTHLLPGHYSIRIVATGFTEYQATAVVQVDFITRVDAQLQIGGSTQTVSVTGESPLLKTDRADVSNTLTGRELGKLPILDRNVTTLLVALPGAGLYSSASMSAAENQQSDQQVPVNGQLSYSNGFLLDGTENHSNILGLSVIVPNPDALEEFKVTSSNYDARFGNASGAMMEGATKSGTNQVHGSAFEYLRNDFFNAADPFTGIDAPIRWNQFGGSLGAPILKNKLFAFFAYQGTRRNLSGALLTTVPTAAERNGDLTSLLGAFICADGSTSASGCAVPTYVGTTQGTAGSRPRRHGFQSGHWQSGW